MLWLPALAWLVWARADRRTRRMCVSAFCSVAVVLLILYPMYAVLKGELIPGKGHVSLLGAIEWQLAQRSTSGSVFVRGTDANALVTGWFDGAPALWWGALAAGPFIMLNRDWRWLGAALGVPLAYMLHPGYLPEMFIIGVIPFAALAIACAGDLVWHSQRAANLAWAGMGRLRGAGERRHGQPKAAAGHLGRVGERRNLRLLWQAGCCVGLVWASMQFVPSWFSDDRLAMTANDSSELRAAETWVERHVPRTASLLVDDNVWIDLVDDGYSQNKVVWFWELDSDPDVERRFPERWRQVDYVVLTDTMRINIIAGAASIPSVVGAVAHSTLVASFGSGPSPMEVRKVGAAVTTDPPAWLPQSDLTPLAWKASGKGEPA